MKKLPIGISTFREIIEENYYYVDKTPYIKKLSDEGKYYFISRPRRFGKSLFADTLKEAFLGSKELFKGLYLEDNWNWSVKYPVVFLSFAGGVVKSRAELDEKINEILNEYFNSFAITSENNSLSGKFRELILRLNKKFNEKVVIIVDEYDKPILDNITDRNTSFEIREGLKNIYSAIKSSDAEIKFAFLTGVSKFSKVSLFSGLNNLIDITLDKRYSEICGYTETDLESIFEERVHGLDKDKIKKWYNGYNFLGQPLFNPFDILLYLDSGEFQNYWFQSATPTFLIEVLKKRNFLIPDFENLYATENLLGSFDIDFIELENLLFQTGYLTIKNVEQLGAIRVFHLTFPNLEVKMSLCDFILQYLTNQVTEKEKSKISLYGLLRDQKIDDLEILFKSFFASIPNDWYRKNQISGYEGYYASVFYCYFTALGLDVRAEDTTNKGRIDMSVKFEDTVYIFEFKVNQLVKESSRALEQIRTKNYHEKFLRDSKDIYLIGVEFDSEERNITNFQWEKLKG